MTTLAMTRPAARRTSPANLLVVAAITGSVLFLAGQALFPVMSENIDSAYAAMVTHRDLLMAARLLTAAGAFLLVPAAVGFARLLPPGARGARLLQVGAWVFGIATFSNALSQTVSGYTAYTATAPGFDATAGRVVVEQIEEGLVALPLGFWSIPAFALGSLLIAIALIRSRTVPTWMPALLIIGTVLAAALAGRGLLVGLTQAPFTIALIALALRIPNRRPS